MESGFNKQSSYNKENIQNNLFSKPKLNIESKNISSAEKSQSEKLLIPKKFNSSIYCRKIPKKEDNISKNFFFKQKNFPIDSLSEVRLPLDFIDLSYDNQKNE